MPLQAKQDGQGRYFVRQAFRESDYTVPGSALEDLERWRGDHYPVDVMLTERDGPFVGYREVKRREREGRHWVLLQRQASEYCIEVEITAQGFGRIVPVEPERAYRIARALDSKCGARIVAE